MTGYYEMEDLVRDVIASANALGVFVAKEDVLKALRHLSTMNLVAIDLAHALVEKGAREGLTQKALAEALGVPASTLRGLKQSL